jgi:hypothetical protein
MGPKVREVIKFLIDYGVIATLNDDLDVDEKQQRY